MFRLERKVDLFIAPSEFVRDQLVSWGIHSTKIAINRNFIMPMPDVPQDAGSGGVYVGRISMEKGLDVLVDALVLAGDPPFMIVGDGPAGDRIARRIEGAGLRRVRMTGRLDASGVLRMIGEARFLVMPSIWDENAPLAVVEAMASGRPVIVTAAGGLPELVRDGGGVVCDPGDASSLAAAIDRLSRDEGAAVRLGREARRFAEQHLTDDRHLAGLQDAYRDAGAPV
jgi:glycosyltransferase involved in cell wall biosynthesis